MVKYFTKSIAKKYSVSSRIPPMTMDTWVEMSMVTADELSYFKGDVLAIESFGVHCSNAETWSPFFVTWDDRDVVKRDCRLHESIASPTGSMITEVHGVANEEGIWPQWSRSESLAPNLDHNVWTFAFTKMQVAYMNLMKKILVCEAGKTHIRLTACCRKEIRVFTLSDKTQVECILSSYREDEPSYDEDEDEDDALTNFLNEILDTPAMSWYYTMFQEPYMKKLVDFGLKLEKDVTNLYVYNDRDYLFPIDAIRKVLEICQEMEMNNYIYHNECADGEMPRPIVCHLFIPKSDTPTMVKGDIQLRIGRRDGDEDECCPRCEEEDVHSLPCDGQFRHANSIVIADRIMLDDKPWMWEENMKHLLGPRSVKKGMICDYAKRKKVLIGGERTRAK